MKRFIVPVILLCLTLTASADNVRQLSNDLSNICYAQTWFLAFLLATTTSAVARDVKMATDHVVDKNVMVVTAESPVRLRAVLKDADLYSFQFSSTR